MLSLPPLAAGVILCAFLLSGCEQPAPGTALPIKPGRIIGGPGGSPGQFTKPRAIDTDGQHLFVVDRSGRIQALDPETGDCIALWRIPDTQLGYPTGITIGLSPKGDGSQAVWVPDTHYNRILCYAMPTFCKPGERVDEQTPQVLLNMGGYGEGPGQFVYPSDIAILPDETGKGIKRIYVSEFGGHDRISIFTPDGKGGLTFLKDFGGPGDDQNPDGFQRPQSIGIDAPTGDLLITDSIDHRIGRFTSEGKLIKWFGQSGIASKDPGSFAHPRGLFLPGDGTALIVEFGNNRVQQIDVSTGQGGGQSLGIWGTPGSGEGELAEPWAAAAIGRRAFIVDARNHRLVEMKLPAARPSSATAASTTTPHS